MTNKLEREIIVIPNDNQLRFVFVLHGQLGTVQFVFHALKRPDSKYGFKTYEHMPWDLGFHWDRKPYKGASKMHECRYREQGYCWYGGSGLNANDVYEAFEKGGTESLWPVLEKYYSEIKAEKK
jgi:hypothetical protein